MLTKTLKVPLSCRIHPRLKKVVEEEARGEGQTTSLYLEKIITNRHQDDGEVVSDLQEEIQELQEEIQELKIDLSHKQSNDFADTEEVDSLKNWQEETAYDLLLQENEELAELNEKQTEELDNLRAQLREIEENVLDTFTEEQRMELQTYLSDLSDDYPHHDEDEIILASLYTAIQNEKSNWTIKTLKNYFKKHKNN